ncbi:MAG: mechanosensitive ion channel, partial [Planctomycetes bacterium]|nr:mechanosensitive ion channel [Planctomycetota bacterium]
VTLTRSLVKIAAFCIIPSLAFLAATYLDGLAARLALDRISITDPALRNLAITCLLISLSLVGIALVGHLLSPELARRRGKPEPPALLRDLVRYGLFILLVAIILRLVWGEDVTPILGALGVGGVVLGFALQETLSNFFAGLALLLEKPFAPGDWIRIGDKAEGSVEHITWRATKIRTRDADYLIFPNSVVAKEVIANFRQPTRVHAIRLGVGTSYEDAPDLVKRTLLEVLATVPDVLRDPPPVVYLREYGSSSINYEVKCTIEDYERRPVIEDQIMDRIWYAFRRAGIEIPFPIQTVFEYRMAPESRPRKGLVDVERVLAGVPLFAAFGREELARLAAAARVASYGLGEPVLRQGDPGDTLFAIAAGSARVAVLGEGDRDRGGSDRGEKTVATLSAGEVFGEMSLLTGDPRTASVYADRALVLVAVSRDALLPLLTENPAAAEKMAEVVTLRKQGLDRVQAEAALDPGRRAEVQTAKASLAGRIRRFFRLG